MSFKRKRETLGWPGKQQRRGPKEGLSHLDLAIRPLPDSRRKRTRRKTRREVDARGRVFEALTQVGAKDAWFSRRQKRSGLERSELGRGGFRDISAERALSSVSDKRGSRGG